MIKKISLALVLASSLVSIRAIAGAMDFRKPSERNDPFAQDIRPTDALTPEQEQKTFHLPPGFEIELVTAEPEIQKPLNMQFDERGRLWVSMTQEYPFPAQPGKGRDTIRIIEIGQDGKATKITKFAEHLNIPIGLYPHEGNVLGHSIPKIWNFVDKDGDGHADEMIPMYGDVGYQRDTHGMTASFRRGFDGWVYATHGFSNTSDIKTEHGDGSAVHLVSGNVYRMKLDGSHIEQFTWGQTNPFGLAFDPMGNLYSSDSHSMPLMNLLRGGYYIGIAKTDDGLGFAPLMMNHSHGSTAIAAATYYGASLFPKEFQTDMFVGNVVTSRINRDKITWNGSSPWANEMPDFLTTDDPWFRPVDIQIGPDGAMYVADFYNKIIGHYEVALTNPLRDHERGRIWRITYKGAPAHLPDWSKSPTDQLITALNDPNLQIRLMVTNVLCDRAGKDTIDAVTTRVTSPNATAYEKMHGMWILKRLDALPLSLLAKFASDSDRGVRVHAMRVLTETPAWEDQHHNLVLAGLKDSDPLVQRCAAEALSIHPSIDNVHPLLALRESVDPKDTQLMYMTRESLRNQVREDGVLAKLDNLSDQNVRDIADVLLSIPNSQAAKFILDHIDALAAERGKITHDSTVIARGRGKVVAIGGDSEAFTKYISHAIRYVDAAGADSAVVVAKKYLANDVDVQLQMLQTIAETSTQVSDQVRGWAVDVVSASIKNNSDTTGDWAIIKGSSAESPWGFESRSSEDGDHSAKFLSSVVFGESLTGTLRSKDFDVPSELSFYLCGHQGYPDHKANRKNLVRLVSSDGKLLKKEYPPRNDTAKKITWDLHDFAGQKAHLELVDGDSGPAYAWLAIGRLSPEVVQLPSIPPHTAQKRSLVAAEIAADLKLTAVAGDLRTLAADTNTPADTRAAAAIALVRIDDPQGAALLANVVKDPTAPIELREKMAMHLAESSTPTARTEILGCFATAPGRVQLALARGLAKNKDGAAALLDAVEAGKVSARLLRDEAIAASIKAAGVPDSDARVKKLTRGIPSLHEEIGQLIATRKAGYLARNNNSPGHGQQIFAHTCAVCHQIGGMGKLIGPQLDGIGNRGLDRVLEDVLDPNANVDPAFRYSILNMKNGNTIGGLIKREENGSYVLVDGAAKQQLVPKDEVKETIQTKLSLMPTNFGEILKENDFYDLLSFLLSQRK